MAEPNAEAQDELEMLRMMYPDDLKEPTGDDKTFSLVLKPTLDDDDDDAEDLITLVMSFAYTPDYPESPPALSLYLQKGNTTSPLSQLQTHLDEVAAESVGDQMVFTLAGEAKDWLEERQQEAIAAAKAKRGEPTKTQAQEEAELKAMRATQTPVTEAVFLEWRHRWDATVGKERMAEADKKKRGGDKLTGREMFLKGKVKDEAKSDEVGIDVNPDAIRKAKLVEQVDESLFGDDALADLPSDEEFPSSDDDDDDDDDGK